MIINPRTRFWKLIPIMSLAALAAFGPIGSANAEADPTSKNGVSLLDTLNWLKVKFEKELPVQNAEAASQKVDVNWPDDMRVVTIKILSYKDANKSRAFSYRDVYEITLSKVSAEEIEKKQSEEKKGVYLSPIRYRRVDDRDAEINSTQDNSSVLFQFDTETMASRVGKAFKHAVEAATAQREAEDVKPPNEPF